MRIVPDFVYAQLNARLDRLPVKRADQLTAGDHVTGVGRVASVEADRDVDRRWHPDGLYLIGFTDGSSMTADGSQELRVGPYSPLEVWLHVVDAASAIVYQRRRSGRVSYYVGPIGIFRLRSPLQVKAEWVGFSRFRF